MTVELVFDDGHVERHDWDGEDRWTRWTVDRAARLVSAELDPDHLLILDVNRVNNSRLLEPRAAPRYKLLTHVLFWLQNLFEAASLPM